MAQGLIVGVDIGGTKTSIRISAGAEVDQDLTQPTDGWRVRDWHADARALTGLVLQACGGATPAAVAVGSHGCDADAHCDAFQAALIAELNCPVRVVNDAELMVPAAGFGEGIGVVSGTGSIAVARTPEGRMLTAGGWGWILGDEGSASALVREAARKVRRALDRAQHSDPLIEALMISLATDDPTKLGRLLDATRGAAAWGRHADAVFRAAEQGSPLARTVIGEGGAGLADLVAVLAERGAKAERVVAGGSVIVEQPSLFAAFAAALKSVSPASTLVLLRDPPVLGAVRLAQRLLESTAQRI